MYALVGTLAAANLLSLCRLARSTSARLGVPFAASAVALAATHYYTVFYFGGAVLAPVLVRPNPPRPSDRVGVQRQVAADRRTLHATAALARHAPPVCRVMVLALGNPPGDGAFRRSFHRVLPFVVRKMSRRTRSAA